MQEPAPSSPPPGFGRRLARSIYAILRALLVVMVLIALLLGVAWGGFWLYQAVRGEIERSAESVATRFAAQESRIDILRREVDSLIAANPGQEEQLGELQGQFTELAGGVDNLTADSNRQAELLAALQAAMTTTLANDDTAAQGITQLNEAFSALQTDLNTNTGQIDALGGELDGLTGRVAQTQDNLEGVATVASRAVEQANLSAATLAEMAQSLTLFRAWELVARARLRLLEGNAGLAAADVLEAQRTLDTLITSLPADAPLVANLAATQTRLTLAADNLPGDPALAASDLESAWDELDKLLVVRLLVAPATPAAAATEESGATAVPPTITPTPTLASTPTPAPSPTP